VCVFVCLRVCVSVGEFVRNDIMRVAEFNVL
jgi:hypothetical protein